MAAITRRNWQFSLLTLLLSMAGVALICLALRSPNELWATAVFAAVLLSLGFAALAAVYRSGRVRAFAIGFLVLGAGYWGLVLLTEREQAYGQPRLPTSRWAVMLFTLLHEEEATVMTTVYTAPYASTVPAYSVQVAAVAGAPPPLPPPTPVVSYVPQQIRRSPFTAETFLDISHQSLALLLGVLGGIVAQWLYATRCDEPSPDASPAA
jgi:hypothetical protein